MQEENSRRKKKKYYFKDNDRVDIHITYVCKKFFPGTLGYPLHNDRMVRDVLSKTCANGLVTKPIKKGHPSEKKFIGTIL